MDKINTSFIMRLHLSTFCITRFAFYFRRWTAARVRRLGEMNKSKAFLFFVSIVHNMSEISLFVISLFPSVAIFSCHNTGKVLFVVTISSLPIWMCSFSLHLYFPFWDIVIIVVLLFEADIIQRFEKSSKLFGWRSYWNWNDNRRHITYFFPLFAFDVMRPTTFHFNIVEWGLEDLTSPTQRPVQP